MLEPAELERRILEALPDATVDVTDLTGTQDHYRVRVVSDAFAGMPALRRHRMVYDAVGSAMGREVHALSVEARTPEEVPDAR